MWAAIKAALRALGNMFSSTVSSFASALWWLDERATSTWNWWARAVSGTGYRPAPVHDMQNAVEHVVAVEPEPLAPSRSDNVVLGAEIRHAVEMVLAGDRALPDALPDDIRLWLLSHLRHELQAVLSASDEQIGRHMTGHACISGIGGRMLDVPDTARDLAVVKSRSRATPKAPVVVIDRARIHELFQTSPAPVEETDDAVADLAPAPKRQAKP